MRLPAAPLAALGALCLLLSLTAPAHAQLNFTFNPDTRTGTQNGASVLFQILLTNGANESSLTGLNVQFDNGTLPDSLINTDPFTTNASLPDPFPAFYSSAGNVDFFTVTLTGVDPGTYNGTATLSYTTDGITSNDVTRPFAVNVNAAPAATTAPEPGSAWLLASTSIPALALVRRRVR